jgi:hypothetical protein
MPIASVANASGDIFNTVSKCAFGIGEAMSDLSPLHGDAIFICRFRRFESLLVWSH